tara:strand:+ start:10 stop:171 length:162 start_codon:yes stop_codon:yes gene_type:complete
LNEGLIDEFMVDSTKELFELSLSNISILKEDMNIKVKYIFILIFQRILKVIFF